MKLPAWLTGRAEPAPPPEPPAEASPAPPPIERVDRPVPYAHGVEAEAEPVRDLADFRPDFGDMVVYRGREYRIAALSGTEYVAASVPDEAGGRPSRVNGLLADLEWDDPADGWIVRGRA